MPSKPKANPEATNTDTPGEVVATNEKYKTEKGVKLESGVVRKDH